jgi:hypothetical protein
MRPGRAGARREGTPRLDDNRPMHTDDLSVLLMDIIQFYRERQ